MSVANWGRLRGEIGRGYAGPNANPNANPKAETRVEECLIAKATAPTRSPPLRGGASHHAVQGTVASQDVAGLFDFPAPAVAADAAKSLSIYRSQKSKRTAHMTMLSHSLPYSVAPPPPPTLSIPPAACDVVRSQVAVAAAAEAFGIPAENVDFGSLEYFEGPEFAISNEFGFVGEKLKENGGKPT